MRAAGEDREGVRLRSLIVVLWRAGLRISEALALAESDLDPDRGSILVRRGKGGRRREVGMDRWAFQQLDPWLEIRRQLPVGSLFCVVRGPTRGRPCSTPAIRVQLRDTAAKAGVRRRFAPHHYADLLFMPIGRGEVLQIVDMAVGPIGIIHCHSRAYSVNDAREPHGNHRRLLLKSVAR
jgi:site-specific recombinase XerC